MTVFSLRLCFYSTGTIRLCLRQITSTQSDEFTKTVENAGVCYVALIWSRCTAVSRLDVNSTVRWCVLRTPLSLCVLQHTLNSKSIVLPIHVVIEGVQSNCDLNAEFLLWSTWTGFWMKHWPTFYYKVTLDRFTEGNCDTNTAHYQGTGRLFVDVFWKETHDNNRLLWGNNWTREKRTKHHRSFSGYSCH